MSGNNFNIKGLSEKDILDSREKNGVNRLDYKKENGFLDAVISLCKEPMVILLLVSSVVYFLSGKFGDGIFLASAIILVSAISLYQDKRSRNALEKLKSFTHPKSKVIRDEIIKEINSDEIVIGDKLMVEEGGFIAADGIIIHSNDFSVNESILTGESMPLFKDKSGEDKQIYSGTTVASGLAIVEVNAIGVKTKLGLIGQSLGSIKEEKTPLEQQIGSFVKKMVVAGILVFLLVWVINFFRTYSFTGSLLEALTLAMSILPEEIPVAFTTFMALGAWRMMKIGIVVKQMKTVETLGSASVICTDKTGTITENKMSLARLYLPGKAGIFKYGDAIGKEEVSLIRLAMWASEPIPFDPMELALHKVYSDTFEVDERPGYKLIHEYPIGGKPPMMTHVFENTSGLRIIAAKGAPEAIIRYSKLKNEEIEGIENAINILAAEGFRVLGVAEAKHNGNEFPKEQQDFEFQFAGLVAFYDPPKKNIREVLDDFENAGIIIKIITGDNALTTVAIAKQIGFKGYEKCISGEELMLLSEDELKTRVMDTNIFTRMFPEAKLKIINALKDNRQVVAMTGDGVNDGPALKAAHIGIAMGKKGTEIAKQAASLILFEDDLASMVDAVAMGRKIYTNLKKAIRYIISIHIPIILTVFIPLALNWLYPAIFTPVHIIFLELIMGPTCSIIYENEPVEKNTMLQKPRPFTTTFFNWRELATSVLQGVIITLGTLVVYQYSVSQGWNEEITRTTVFTTLISANIFLTLVNRSFYYSILTTLRYKNKLVPLIICLTIALNVMLIFVRPMAVFFKFQALDAGQGLISLGAGFVSVMWFELVKWSKRTNAK